MIYRILGFFRIKTEELHGLFLRRDKAKI